MSTPHIAAQPGDFAETVLMPGDPLRAKYIAETFFTEIQQVNEVRNMFGYTGLYKGHRISVMGSGMGVPSISIYAHELYSQFGVKNIIRVGTCGGLHEDVKIRDVVIGQSASTDSNVNRTRFRGYDFSAAASYSLLEPAVQAARQHGARVHVGGVFTADLFYSPDNEILGLAASKGHYGVEMEAAGLYGVAADNGCNALAICTVSDHIITGEKTSPEERQSTFNDMIEIALDSVLIREKGDV
ncbi:purine-nucleoside phosphorylase [Gynuella sp.]|uniref:purine-nucleoside phosphorylase n=1 Tax=Gynuella sp. TaxID=2969146 RepID=UPI003D10443E